MNETVKERLISYADDKKLTLGKFEKAAGLSNGYVKSIRKSISEEMLERIALNFPDIDKEWIMTGKRRTVSMDAKAGKNKGVPYYDVDVFAGNVETYNEGPQVPVSYLQMPGVEDCDFSCRVSGISMSDKILPGAIIACKEIKDKTLLSWGEVYVIITAENRWVKYVRKHENTNYILLKSHATGHDDIDCPIDKILKIFAVKIIMNQERM